jgi:hypothetical protein
MLHRYFIACIFALFITNSIASGFEGNITFVKQTFYDTTYYIFTVKDRLVRIDEKSAKSEVMQSLIIDLNKKNITALSPSQKLFTNIQKFSDTPDSQKDFTVIKSENFKIIDGRKCYLWRVRSKSLNMETSFWVFDSSFGFFSEVIGLLSLTQDYSRFCLYFDQIPGSQGYFPMLMVEKTLLREEKMKVLVQQINRKKVDEKSFSIPKGYRCLRY